MPSIEFVTVEAADAPVAERFYDRAFDVGTRVRVRGSDAAPTGFRSFTLSLIVSQPGNCDLVVASAVDAGATVLKQPAKSMWGYGGVVRAPEGTIWTVASSSKKDSTPATGDFDDLVLQLGVADVAVSKQFYVDRGLPLGKSYGRKYAEFKTGPVKLALYKRAGLAKLAGVPDDGSDSHGVEVSADAGGFTDPDGFAWKG